MTWFLLWLCLILASIIYFSYIGFVLWRKVMSAARQLEATSAALETFEAKQEAYAEQLPTPRPPALLDSEQAAGQYHVNKLRRRTRYHNRQLRHAKVHGTWDDIYR